MDRLRRTLSFRLKRKENAPSTTVPDGPSTKTNKAKAKIWSDDERSVRVGLCKFHVKYLGSIEVQESRGVSICEQAIQALLNNKSKPIKAILHVSGDSLRLVDETNMSLILDQTIDKVSFCAPDRHRQKGFAYICRDGTTRQWRCHGFLAVKENGERLSHAVGCAFEICAEKKEQSQQCTDHLPIGTSFSRSDPSRTTSVMERSTHLQSFTRSSTTLPSNGTERARPKGTQISGLVCYNPLRIIDLNQSMFTEGQRQNSFRVCHTRLDQNRYYPEPIYEEVEPDSAATNTAKLYLTDATNTYKRSSTISTWNKIHNQPWTDENGCSSDSYSCRSPILVDEGFSTPRKSILNDAFDTNLTALSQSNRPRNPFSPYAYSIAAQSQSNHLPSYRSSIIITPKRNTNPFTEDVKRM